MNQPEPAPGVASNRKPDDHLRRPENLWPRNGPAEPPTVPCVSSDIGECPLSDVNITIVSLANPNPPVSMDLLPTMAMLTKAALPKAYQVNGHDIRPIIFGQTKTSSPYSVLYHFAGSRLGAVRSGPWKMIMARGGKNKKPMELYNLEDDIGETNDLIEQHP